MRVAIVYPRANLESVPSLIGATEELAARGFEVEVLTYSPAGQPPAVFNSPRVRVRSLGVDGLVDHSTARLRGLVRRATWLPDVARARLARGYRALGAGLAGGSRLAARARGAVAERSEPYRCVIGVDPDGLALAHSIARGAPLGYFSLELLLSSELTTAAEARHLAGLVIDGGVRDVDALRAHAFPAFSTCIALPGATKQRPGAVSRSIQVGGVTVATGDWVVGDADGIAVVANRDLDTVLAAAWSRADKETAMFDRLRQGSTTLELLGLDPRSVERHEPPPARER